MNRGTETITRALLLLVAGCVCHAIAREPDVRWWTIDNGGVIRSQFQIVFTKP